MMNNMVFPPFFSRMPHPPFSYRKPHYGVPSSSSPKNFSTVISHTPVPPPPSACSDTKMEDLFCFDFAFA